jgi:hypothetical protein
MKKLSSRYQPLGDGIVCRRPERFFNRPLYCTNCSSVVLAGEMPEWLLAHETFCFGRITPRIQIERRKWNAKHPQNLTTTFRGNRVEYDWMVGGASGLKMEVYPSVTGTGCWIAATSASQESVKLRLRWSGICATTRVKAGLNAMDPAWNRELFKGSLGESEPRKYRATFDTDRVRAIVEHPSYHVVVNQTGKGATCDPGLVDEPLTIVLKWSRGQAFRFQSKEAVAEVEMDLSPDQPQAWIWWGDEKHAPSVWAEGNAAREFQVRRTSAIQFSTPSRELDATIPHAVSAAEGAYYPPFFVHGCLCWNTAYLGWSVYYKGAVLGWADRLRKLFGLAFDTQETREAADPYQRNAELTMAGPDSHFHGRGHIDFHQYRYNMQEVFFDQVIEAHAHRLLGDSWLRTRKALEEHAVWEKRCFDPADSGIFESCINTWASDSVWYNGGPGPIATAYNYRVNFALGRIEEARRIQQVANRKLWLKRKGWYVEYLDPGPNPLPHESACLYSIYLPITCGLADEFQSRQLLEYAKHELENVTFKNHPGRLCWLSQWVPYHWSVRELGHGETLMLAQAAFIAGDADLGWDYLQGVIYNSQYGDVVPGGLQMQSPLGSLGYQGATDFGDPVSIYLWTVSRGLAGFRPVPSGPLRWEPSLPTKWTHADLQFPDHGVRFKREEGKDEWSFRQLPGQDLEIDLPLPGNRAIRVSLDDKPFPFEIRAKAGAPCLHLSLQSRETHRVVVEATGERPWHLRPRSQSVRVGGRWEHLAPKGCRILELRDPQEVLKDVQQGNGSLRGTIDGLPGHRLVFVKLESGECQWWQPVTIRVRPVAPPPVHVPRKIRRSALQTFSLESFFNGELKDFCAKRCVAPRPKTCGAQIGIDGYSPWTYPLWKKDAPVVDAALWHKRRSAFIVDGISFARPSGPRDAVLVSRWDHLPREVVIPLGIRLKRLYLLTVVSTSVMQAHMDILKLTLVGESQDWTFPLNHPRDILSGIHDYNLKRDRSALPLQIPRRVPLGTGLQGCVLQFDLLRQETVRELRWECLALETIGGLLGVSCS